MINIKYDEKNKQVKMEIDLEKIGIPWKIENLDEKVVKENLNEIPENIGKVFSEILNKFDSALKKENKKAKEIVISENNLFKIIKKENENSVVLWFYFSDKIPKTILANAKFEIMKENNNILKNIVIKNINTIFGLLLIFGIDSQDISKDKLLADSIEIKYKPNKHAYRIFIKKYK